MHYDCGSTPWHYLSLNSESTKVTCYVWHVTACRLHWLRVVRPGFVPTYPVLVRCEYWDIYIVETRTQLISLFGAKCYLQPPNFLFFNCLWTLRRIFTAAFLLATKVSTSAIWDWSRSYCRYELTRLSPELEPNLIFLNSDMSNACLDTKRRSSLKSSVSVMPVIKFPQKTLIVI